jgi:hypothetical protein
MNRMAYTQGAQAALYKYAGGVGDVVHSVMSSPNLKRNLNVAGLGLIAAPTMHSMLSSGEDSPALEKTKHLSDLAGLGLLIGTEFMKH